MDTQELLGRKVKDSKSEYKNDTGTIKDIRHFTKANKTYAVVKWDKNSKHGDCYRNYSPNEFGGFMKRLKLL